MAKQRKGTALSGAHPDAASRGDQEPYANSATRLQYLSPNGRNHPKGFTLIELLVVLAIVALLLTIVAPRTIDHLERARETTLKATLKEMRSALDQFEADQGHPPATLDELVRRKYLRELPIDPVTDKRDTWISITPAEARPADAPPTKEVVLAEGVADVRSGAEGAGRDGTPYRSW